MWRFKVWGLMHLIYILEDYHDCCTQKHLYISAANILERLLFFYNSIDRSTSLVKKAKEAG